MKNKIVLPEAPILVESTRSIGYSFEAAVADIIDNSISADASEIYINFQSAGNPYLCIIDNGMGMTLEELEQAMRYGSKSSREIRSKNDLGRFGLGMKMASLSQCRKVTVVTKKNNQIHAAAWDLDYIIETDDWTLKLFSEAEAREFPCVQYLDKFKSGTVVIWQEFDRIKEESANFQKAFDDKVNLTKDHVALVFHRFLNGDVGVQNHIKLYFNNDEIHGIDPFLTSNPATQRLSEQDILIGKERIKVKPYVLPMMSKISKKDIDLLGGRAELRLKQGFYIYRNKRLIIWGTWFRLIKQNELRKLARVRVDIPNTLDSIWEIDIKKSKASLPYMIKKNLTDIVINTVGRSEKVYRYRGRNVNNDEFIHPWDVIKNRGNYEYKINRDLPILKSLEQAMDDSQVSLLESYLDLIEKTFPYGDVYCRISQNEMELEKKDKNEKDEVYQQALAFIHQIGQTNGDIDGFINLMKMMEPFCKYPDIVQKVEEKYKNE